MQFAVPLLEQPVKASPKPWALGRLNTLAVAISALALCCVVTVLRLHGSIGGGGSPAPSSDAAERVAREFSAAEVAAVVDGAVVSGDRAAKQ